MKQIKFTASGANSAFGGFATGDTARVDDALARHLVEEARCAVYVGEQSPVEQNSSSGVVEKKKRRGAGANAISRGTR